MGCTEKYAADKKLHVSGHKGFDLSRNSQNKNIKSKFFQNESFFSFSLKCFDLNCIPRKNTIIDIAQHHSYSSKHSISKKIVCLLLKFKEIMRFRRHCYKD